MSFSSVHPASARATQLRRSGTSPVARDMRSPTSAPACCSTGSTPVAATAPTSAGCARVGTVALLVLDDFGLTPLPEHQQQDLYEVICNRYERHATVITSNRDFNEWPLVFANPLMASATMDRLVASRRQDRHRGQELSHGQLRASLTGTAAALGGPAMRPYRPGARGCPRYHLARPRGLTGRPGAIFSQTPDRNVPRNPHPGPCRHGWPLHHRRCMSGLRLVSDGAEYPNRERVGRYRNGAQ